MGYTLELGYWQEKRKPPTFRKVGEFSVAKVKPFIPLGTINADPLTYELTGEAVRAIDDEGLVEASVDITSNYSPRISEITGLHLAHLHGLTGAEAAPTFMTLVSELGDELGETSWEATDGNIKALAACLLDWTFQHPNAQFVKH